MTTIEPPSVATWLLKHLGRRNEALAGDILEGYRRGRSVSWYWRQVLTAILVSRSREALLTVGILAIYGMGRYVSLPGTNTRALVGLGGQTGWTSFQFYNLFVGGNLAPVSMFALGILPYVSASIFVPTGNRGRKSGGAIPRDDSRLRDPWRASQLCRCRP